MITAAFVFFFGIAMPSSLTDHDEIIEETPIELPEQFPQIEPVPEFISEPILEVKKREGSESFEWPGDLKRICSCESTGRPGNEPRHFDSNGEVLRGKVNPLDTGMCQINKKYHGAEADRLGLDLEIQSENFEYAARLYRQQGSQPWSWSASCWAQ